VVHPHLSEPSSVSITEVLALVVMVVVLLGFLRNHYGVPPEVEYRRASSDGRKYLVRKLPDAQRAADTLADLGAQLSRLVRHMVEKNPGDEDVARIARNYNPNNLSEGGWEHGYTSYAVNKGEQLVLCIRQKDGAFVARNVMLYVAIHELAHLMTREVGHDRVFWANFKRLLDEAVALGMYEPEDYARTPKDYCGIRISSSIMYQ